MPKGYRPYWPDQDFLLPPSLSRWLPEGRLAYIEGDAVDQLDWAPMHAEYGDERRGQPRYDPRMMTKLLVYGYCERVYSSRKILERLQEDVAYLFSELIPPQVRYLSRFCAAVLLGYGIAVGRSRPFAAESG